MSLQLASSVVIKSAVGLRGQTVQVRSGSLADLEKALEAGADANYAEQSCSLLGWALVNEDAADLISMLLEVGISEPTQSS